VPPARVNDVTLLAAVCAVIGGRLAFVAVHPEDFAADWWTAVQPWSHGGLMMYGGAIPAIVACMWALRRWGVDPWRAADAAAPGIAVGIAVTRVGCFLAGCCLGTETSLPWGVHFPGDAIARHPVQLYATAFGLALAAVLLVLDRRPRPPGRLFLLFLLLHGTGAILIDGMRAWDVAATALPGPLVTNQLVALASMLLAAALLWRRSRLEAIPHRG
jgi:phosphatidylglycerol:prolipoprotein diacylglycerol transferase